MEPNSEPITLTADLRAAILSCTKLKEQHLQVPEWNNAVVLIREMKAKDRNKVMQDSTRGDGTRDLVKFYPLITILSTFNPGTNEQIFQLADLDSLNEQGGSAMERVCQLAVKLSGLDGSQFAEAKND